MSDALLLVGLLGFLTGIIWLVLSLIRKRSKKKPLLCIVICLALAIGGVESMPNSSETEPSADLSTNSPSFEGVNATPKDSPSINSDWEIITREGHPTYYGSVKNAHQCWVDVKKGKIIYPDRYDKWNDDSIISLDAYRDSDLIRAVYMIWVSKLRFLKILGKIQDLF